MGVRQGRSELHQMIPALRRYSQRKKLNPVPIDSDCAEQL